jgi:hypothetical protein
MEYDFRPPGGVSRATKKLINTNGNTEGITVGKKIKQSKKNDDVSGFTNGITDGIKFRQ